MTKLCPSLTCSPGFFGHFESLAFFENGGRGTNLTPKQSNRMLLVNFSKVQHLSNNHFKNCGYFYRKMRTTPTIGTIIEDFSTKNKIFVENLWLLNYFLGTKVTTLAYGRSTLRLEQIKLIWMFFLLSKVDNIQKPCLSLKSGLFPLVYWFVNLTLTDKHGTKNFYPPLEYSRDSTCFWGIPVCICLHTNFP